MKELTKAEEQVMHYLWEMEKAFVKDVVERFPEPRPAYNTISTIIRILEKKGFVGHHDFGKTFQYYPLISKKTYTQSLMKSIMKKYFGNSLRQMVSFFSKEKGMSVSELEELKKLIEDEIKSKE